MPDFWVMRSSGRPAEHPRMGIKDGWIEQAPPRPVARLSADAEAVIARASALTPDEILRLDAVEQPRADVQLIAWDVLRSHLATGDAYTMRLSARARAWAAVNASLRSLGLATVADDGCWRVTTGTGWGAARAARFAACALVAPTRVDPDLVDVLTTPWRSIRRLP
jgi:hypothetical protein